MSLIKVKARGSEAIGRRNLVINGDMRVAQRGTSESGLTDSPAFVVFQTLPDPTVTYQTLSLSG